MTAGKIFGKYHGNFHNVVSPARLLSLFDGEESCEFSPPSSFSSKLSSVVVKMVNFPWKKYTCKTVINNTKLNKMLMNITDNTILELQRRCIGAIGFSYHIDIINDKIIKEGSVISRQKQLTRIFLKLIKAY